MARLWGLSLKSLCFSITVEAFGSVAGAPEEMSRLSKEVEELRGGLSQLLARTRQMSSAGSTRAKTVSYPPSMMRWCFAVKTCRWLLSVQVLRALGLREADGHLRHKLEDVPSDFASVDAFDMAEYANEVAATPPFATYLEVGSSYVHVLLILVLQLIWHWGLSLKHLPVLQGQLVAAGASMGENGFAVLDLHAGDGHLELTVVQQHGPITYTGILDVGVVPHGAMGDCTDVLRVGIELKYTKAYKAARGQVAGAALRSCTLRLPLCGCSVTDCLTHVLCHCPLQSN